jgi:hypothetical protein
MNHGGETRGARGEELGYGSWKLEAGSVYKAKSGIEEGE